MDTEEPPSDDTSHSSEPVMSQPTWQKCVHACMLVCEKHDNSTDESERKRYHPHASTSFSSVKCFPATKFQRVLLNNWEPGENACVCACVDTCVCACMCVCNGVGYITIIHNVIPM